LQEALVANYKTGDIRLREGEYRYDLEKAIASFQLELYFPDVKDIIKDYTAIVWTLMQPIYNSARAQLLKS